MPIYEYICEDCQTHFEKIVLNRAQEIACPKCAGKKNAIQLSVFSSANGAGNGATSKASGGFTGGGGSCCGGGRLVGAADVFGDRVQRGKVSGRGVLDLPGHTKAAARGIF